MTQSAAMAAPLHARNIGQRFGRKWVLRGCSFEVRPHVVTALVGPNGVGKSTLMAAATGLLQPTEGRIDIAGTPAGAASAHPDLGYLAQDKPLYKRYRVRDLLQIGRHLNVRWDAPHAESLVAAAGLDPDQRVGTLSGGQRTRLALALVLGRRPSILLLDEPLADLDPLARLEVSQTLMAEVADTGMTVLMSSHILGEVADLCEDLLVMSSGRISLAGSIDDVLATHRVLVGPAASAADLGFLPEGSVIEARHAARQTTLIVDRPVDPLPEGWVASDPTLDEVVVAYLRAEAGAAHAPASTTPQSGVMEEGAAKDVAAEGESAS